MPHLLDVISGQATQTFSKKRTALCLFQSCVNIFFQCYGDAQGRWHKPHPFPHGRPV